MSNAFTPCFALARGGRGRIREPDPVARQITEQVRFIISQVRRYEKLSLSQIREYKKELENALNDEDYQRINNIMKEFVNVSFGIQIYEPFYPNVKGDPIFLTLPDIEKGRSVPAIIFIQKQEPRYRYLLWIKHSFLIAKNGAVAVAFNYSDIKSITDFLKTLNYIDTERVGIIREKGVDIAEDLMLGVRCLGEFDFENSILTSEQIELKINKL
jgi:hypothetical protein